MAARVSQNRLLDPALPPEQKIIRILSLTGGGMRGLFTAHALATMDKQAGLTVSDRFDVFAGTSVGGIVAIGLAAGIPADKIATGLEEHGPKIFERSRKTKITNPWNLFAAGYHPQPLQAAIRQILGKKADMPISKLKKNLLIVAADHETTRPIIFAAGEVATKDNNGNISLFDAAMATSAAQSYFPPHKVGDRLCVDGGLVSNAPDIVATVRTLHSFSASARGIKLLSVGTTSKELRGKSSRSWGLLSWITRQKLPEVAFELQQALSMGLSKQLLGDDYYRLDSQVAESIRLDDSRPETLQLLKQKAEEAVQQFRHASDEWHNILS